MAWTKAILIDQAFGQLGMGGEFDTGAEEQEFAARELDAMMGEWDGRGIRVSWPIPITPATTDLDAELSIPFYAPAAIYLNLALRLAPSFGKTVMPQTLRGAAEALQALRIRRTARPVASPYPSTLPMGSGNTRWQWGGCVHFYPPPSLPLQADGDVDNDFD